MWVDASDWWMQAGAMDELLRIDLAGLELWAFAYGVDEGAWPSAEVEAEAEAEEEAESEQEAEAEEEEEEEAKCTKRA